MTQKRVFANAVTLPNGQTFVVGGQIQPEPFYDCTWTAIPEIYTPDKADPGEPGTWKEAAHHSTPRTYHSIALLLPDATVFVGGSGLGGNEPYANHFDAQIYHPPYFYKDGKSIEAQRPNILKTAPEGKVTSVKVGDTITFTTDKPVDSASLIRYSGVTHSLNNDQRRINLKFDSAVDKTYKVTIPEDKGVALPGYWMLFAMDKGLPSVSHTVHIQL